MISTDTRLSSCGAPTDVMNSWQTTVERIGSSKALASSCRRIIRNYDLPSPACPVVCRVVCRALASGPYSVY